MRKQLKAKGSMPFLSFLCCLAYFTSYLTRLNYAACLIEIQDALHIGKSQASLPVMGCFLVYGAGQLVCGFFGDRLMPHKIIFTGLAGTAVCNLLVAMFPDIIAITWLWCANGFFQSMLWPPLVRIMAEMLDEVWYRRCSVLVSFSSSFGTIAIYVLAPLCLPAWGWKSMFLLPSAAGFLTAFYWIYNTRGLKWIPRASGGLSGSFDNDKGNGLSGMFHAAPLLTVMFVIALHGVLKDGITTWMPAYMADTFGMSTELSILTTAVLPVFSIASTLLASLLFYRIRDELCTASVLFAVALVSGIFMFLVNGKYPLGCIGLMMVITGCMFGVNLMLISRMPRHFARYGMVSTISGILNAATYIGSALATYGFGWVAESNGWSNVIGIWIASSAGAILLLLCSIRQWKNFVRMND